MADPQQLGPYRIERKLGRGGMGAVYVGVHRDTGDRAAVKVLIPQLAEVPGFRERFSAEIDSLKRLDHANIVRLFGFGEDTDGIFYAMELVDGGSLEEELQRGRRFTWREVTNFAISLSKALKHAHDHGIIHRDIKPANLLLSKAGVIKLTDFGIARLFGNTGLTSDGGLLGTAEYMSPEQAEGKPVTPACDLYSLGGVLYALLAGRPPFRGKNLPEMLHMQRFATPEPVSTFAPDTPVELEKIVMRLLEKEADKRFPDATVLNRQLAAMLEQIDREGPQSKSIKKPVPPRVGSADVTQAHSDATSALPDRPAKKASDPTRVRDEAPPRAAATKPQITDAEAQARAAQTVAAPAGPRFTTVADEARKEAERRRQAESPWRHWQTYVMIAGLALIGFAVYWYMRPPSAEQLFAKIQRQAEEGGPQGLSFVEDEMASFLEHFPEHAHAKQVKSYQEELQVATAERRLTNRTARGSTPGDLKPLEREYLAALEISRKFPDIGLTRFKALQVLCEQTPDDPKVAAVAELCRQRITKLQDEIVESSREQLPWIDAQLAKATAVEKSDPAAARAIRQAIIVLYGDRSWAASRVEQAKQAQTAAEKALPK